MNLISVGINHKTTPIEIREKLFLNSTQQELLLSELKNMPAILSACILSTCNRVEIYAHVLDLAMDVDPLIKSIFQIKKIPYASDFSKYFYLHKSNDAIRHLFGVSSGLDSLVVGEDQILGQVKTAFDCARNFGMLDRHFNILADFTIRTGKKARNETDISYGGSSISWAAVVKAEEILGSLNNHSILMIGAGEMSRLAVGHIQNKQFKELYLMSRTQNNAELLAEQYGGNAVPFCDLKEVLSRVDICICSAGAPHYLIEKDIVDRIMRLRQNRQLLFIDISMPRNIDPQVSKITNVLLVQLDELKEVVGSTARKRNQAIKAVQKIILVKLAEFEEKIQKLPNLDDRNARESLTFLNPHP